MQPPPDLGGFDASDKSVPVPSKVDNELKQESDP